MSRGGNKIVMQRGYPLLTTVVHAAPPRSLAGCPQGFVHEVAVFYRTSPRQKLSIVLALQVIIHNGVLARVSSRTGEN